MAGEQQLSGRVAEQSNDHTSLLRNQ